MKVKGFTLVELLAVIIILAIIALIAVPIMIGMINNSKKSSSKEGINLYTDTVEKVITKKQLNNPNFSPEKCIIETDGNLECFNGTSSLGIIKIDMKGNLPISGIILIKESEIIFKNIVLNGKTYYESDLKLLEDISPAGISIGDKYSYKVNDTDRFNFYVLSIEEDNTINLIMDRNICEDGTVKYTYMNNFCKYNWYLDNQNNNFGPTNIMQKLYNATKNWTNVTDMIINYTDENNASSETVGYIGIKTDLNTKITTITGKNGTSNATIGTSAKPLKARLATENETRVAECTESDGSCPTWLMENITYSDVGNNKYSMNNNNEIYQNQIYGYWLLASYPGFISLARGIDYRGRVGHDNTGYSKYGIRPVVTVNIDDL